MLIKKINIQKTVKILTLQFVPSLLIERVRVSSPR